jgi:peptide/nickel transport system permease protein
MSSIDPAASELLLVRGRSRPALILRAIVKDPALTLSFLLLVTLAVCAVFPAWVAPHDPNAQQIYHRFVKPFHPTSGIGFLGSDALGRDILSRLVYGSRVSLGVAAAAVTLAGGIGVTLGFLAGMGRRLAASTVMRVADLQFSIPALVLALVMVAILGPGIGNVIIVLAIGGWVAYARVTRAQVLVVKQREYVGASRGLGASTWWLVRRHVLPNTVGVVAIIAALEMGQMMITEASLSFLGLGVPAGTADWGAMISDGRDYLATAWWVSAFPGIAIVITVAALNVIGDWLSDRTNPVLRGW